MNPNDQAAIARYLDRYYARATLIACAGSGKTAVLARPLRAAIGGEGQLGLKRNTMKILH